MKHLLSILIIFISMFSCKAQQIGERLTKTSVVIFNNSKNSTSILLGESSSQMDTFKLKGNEVWLSPAYAHNPMIKVQTGKRIISYLLKPGNYYMIFWNDKKKYWDVKKTKKT